MDAQIVIKVLLIAVFAAFALILLMPGRGARRLAVRRIALLVLFAAAIAAIAFPQLVNDVARVVGIGRGTDLILYGLVIVFVGNALSASVRFRHQEREITRLARSIALRDAPPPSAGRHSVGDDEPAA
ncbi:MAG TPA: DUF2304 domain-containing protein [Candidatus Lumbricidophila sp.]|nr:DUF2304 domain-containing protein [Candidatus Lumbricidophila sp.]